MASIKVNWKQAVSFESVCFFVWIVNLFIKKNPASVHWLERKEGRRIHDSVSDL